MSVVVDNTQIKISKCCFLVAMRLKRLKNKVNPLMLITIGLLATLAVLFIGQFSRPVPEVLIANEDLAEGTKLRIADFQAVGIDLGLAQGSYVAIDQFPAGNVLARSISKGEVLAKGQVAEFGPAGFTVLRLKPELPIAESVEIGDAVSVWVVQGEQFEELEPAEQISYGRLMAIQTSEGLFADEQPYVEITIPELTLPEVLKSMAANDKVFLVEPGL
jgi:hypothetical protein